MSKLATMFGRHHIQRSIQYFHRPLRLTATARNGYRPVECTDYDGLYTNTYIHNYKL